MIVFSWRQFRSQALIGAAGLVLVGVVLALTGPHLVHVYDSELAACRASNGQGIVCNYPVTGDMAGLQIALNAVVLLVPALLGMFWGAPLIARELETGTFRLAWTQSVGRLRWLLVKMGLVGLAAMVVAGGLSLMSTWWFSPLDKVNQNRFSPAAFGLHGFVPAGYALFAFALGAAVGLVVRRTLPAMAITLAGFIAVRVVVAELIRPHFLSPVTTSLPLGQAGAGFEASSPGSPLMVVANAPNLPNALVSGASITNAAGQSPTAATIKRLCPSLGQGPPAGFQQTTSSGGGPFGGHTSVQSTSQQAQQVFNQCLDRLSSRYHVLVTYQPANRFWTFQTMETALFVVLSALLVGGCAWWIRHRIR
jgi:ABC-type transport system involved in multi-copper enzyme maturation permease subunit